MAFIVIHRRESKSSARELKRIANALERLCDIIGQPQPDDTSIEILSIDKQKHSTPEDEEIPDSRKF